MKSLFKMLVVVCLLGTAYGQHNGIPAFSAADTHEFDTVNLTTLLPVFNFPVVSKNGAIPFNVMITSPQYCSIANGPGYTYWTCGGSTNSLTAPFIMVPNSLLGMGVQYTTTTQGFCVYYHMTGLTGSDGISNFPFTATQIGSSSQQGAQCGNSSATLTTIDGTGYTATISTTSTAPPVINSLYSRGGSKATSSGNWGTDKLADTFGNAITQNNNTFPYSFTDTLNTTSLEQDRRINPNTYTYTDTDGTQRSITLTLGAQTTLQPLGSSSCVTGPSQPSSVTPVAAINYPDGTYFGIGWQPNKGGISGIIGSITLRTGGTISYTYGPLTTPCSGTFTSLSRTTPDGTTTYSYSNGVTTVLDPGQNKTVYTFNGPGTYITEIQKYQNTGTVASPVYTLIASDVYCYNGNQSNCAGNLGVAYPTTRRDVYHYIGSTSLAMSHTTEIFDTHGNVTSSAKQDYVTGQTITTGITYGSWNGSSCVYVGSNIYDHPCDVLSTDGAHNLSESHYTYNAQGFETSSSVWTGSSWLTTGYTPNATGTIGSVQAPNGQVTSIRWDATGSGGCNGMLPTGVSTIVNGVAISSSKTWDCNTSLPLTTTDANGNGTISQYDFMLRPATVVDESGFPTDLLYPTSNTYGSSASFGSSVMNYMTMVDGLGRPIVRQTQQGAGSFNYDTVSSSYAFSGPNYQVSMSSPCVQTSYQPCPTVAKTSVANPVRGPLSTTDANGGTVTYGYNKNDSSLTAGPAPSGEHVKTVQTEVDGLGRTKSVCALQTSGGTACGQAMGGSGILNTYSYSFGTGTSTASTTRGSQTHTATSDALGRVTSSTTPESGTTTYIYDVASATCGSGAAAGALVETVDNAGVHTCLGIDILYRTNHSVLVTNGVWSNARWYVYGDTSYTPPVGVTIHNGIGRIVEAYVDIHNNGTKDVDEWFSYDKNGRMTDMWESTPHSGGYYHTTAAYNPNGAVASISGIPGFSSLTYGVDGEGRAKTASLGSTVLINGVTYDAASRPISTLIGTLGDSDTFTYDSVENMKTYTFSVNGKTQAGTLTWDPDGTLGTLAITDSFNAGGAHTCNFTYDDAARLTDDNCGSTLWHQTFGYDQYDNLTKTGNPGTSWNPGYNAANNQMLGSAYDSDGHLTYDGVSTYSWDAYGKMVGTRTGSIAPSCGAGGSFCATYDAMGRTVETSNGGTYRWYLYGPTGMLAQMFISGSVSEARLPLPAGVTARTTSGVTVYMDHPDWLGTKRLSTTLGGRAQRYDTAFSPYGEAYDSFGTMTPDFTGDRQDVAAGLFDTPNRELAANASRWISPDPAGASWNAYAYATNPNSQTDQSGLGADEGIPKDDICGDLCSGMAAPLICGNSTQTMPCDSSKAEGEGFVFNGHGNSGSGSMTIPSAAEHWYDSFGSMIRNYDTWAAHVSGSAAGGHGSSSSWDANPTIRGLAKMFGTDYASAEGELANGEMGLIVGGFSGPWDSGEVYGRLQEWRDLRSPSGWANGDINFNHMTTELFNLANSDGHPLQLSAQSELEGWMQKGGPNIHEAVAQDPSLLKYFNRIGIKPSGQDFTVYPKLVKSGFYNKYSLYWDMRNRYDPLGQ